MVDWSQIAGEVAAALGEVGYTATLCRAGASTGPEYDQIPSKPTKHELTVLNDQIRLGLVDGKEVRATDKLITVASTGVVPTQADTIVLAEPDSVTLPADNSLPGLKIVRVSQTAPGGVDLLYEVLLRA